MEGTRTLKSCSGLMGPTSDVAPDMRLSMEMPSSSGFFRCFLASGT
jgi:hypothetical protein